MQDAGAVEAVRAVDQEAARLDPLQLVQTLTQRFGPRLTGSESEHQSAAWVLGGRTWTLGTSAQAQQTMEPAKQP